MKVLLLGFGKIAYMPYLHLYTDMLKNADCELVYWDRDGKPDNEPPACICKTYCFASHLEERLPFKKKLVYFWKYRQFVRKILKKNKYEFIYVMHTTPGLTLLDILRREYKGRYSLDFRDISYEYIGFYRKLVGILAKNAKFTFVSSDAFRKFLPPELPIYTVHNYLEDSLNHRDVRTNVSRAVDVIRVSYWGLIRQVNVNKKLIDRLGNDSRFELHYYGRMQQDGRDMEAYAKTRGYSNVFFHGSYMPNDRYAFAAKTDILHNVYDTGHTTGNAMGNKYYDGVIFKLPQICTKGSYMAERIEREGIGLSVDLDDPKLADLIWEYYQGIQWNDFENKCDSVFLRVCNEQTQAKRLLQSILDKEGNAN